MLKLFTFDDGGRKGLKFCRCPADSEAQEQSILAESLEGINQGVQKCGEEHDVVCIAEIGEVEVVHNAEIRAMLCPAVQPVINRDIEEVQCGDTVLRTPEVVKNGSDIPPSVCTLQVVLV